MKRFISFLICAVYVLSMGGICFLFYDKHTFFAIIAILNALAFLPHVIKHFKQIIGSSKELKQ